jgi:hypothetical protein
MDDPAAGVSEMARVTRPGGVVAASSWDFGGGMEMLRVYWESARELDHDLEARAVRSATSRSSTRSGARRAYEDTAGRAARGVELLRDFDEPLECVLSRRYVGPSTALA